MEQGTKKCPYCGEEILAVAKKCKHCGEWLNKPPQKNTQKQPVRKESYFDPKYRYDGTLMNGLFWVTIAGSFIQALHRYGVADDLIIRGSSVIKFIFSVAKFFSMIPEAIGDFLFFAGEITFVYLLMKTMSNYHKPLKSLFIINLAVILFSYFIDIVFDDHVFNENGYVIILLVMIICPVLLGTQIIQNYEGTIRNTGWVIIIYSIISIIVAIIGGFIAFPIACFLLYFFTDYFYLKYLRDILSN